MNQFCKIFETAGHQVLVRFGFIDASCPCGKPGCSDIVLRPVLQVETRATINGQAIALVSVLACDTAEQQARGLARFDKALAADALVMLQGVGHGTDTQRQSQQRIAALKAVLFA